MSRGRFTRAALRSPRELLAEQYEREGRGATAAKIRRGETPSESVLRALRAVAAAQAEAVALRVARGGRAEP